MILGQVSWLDCIVFLIFLAPQLIIKVGFFRTLFYGLRALPFLLIKLPISILHERLLTRKRKRSPFVQQASWFEDIVIRCVRYAFAYIPASIGRVFFSKEIALPFFRFRLLRYGYWRWPIHWHEVRRVHQDNLQGIWIIEDESREPDVVVYYAHGGGFSMGSSYFYLEFLHAWLHLLKSLGGFQNPAIFALEYTLVPDESYPTQLHQTVAGYKHILSNFPHPSRICVSGDSAGGTLILSLLLHLANGKHNITLQNQESILPGFAVLISPWTTLISPQDKNTRSDYINVDSLRVYARQYANFKISLSDPLISPGNCKDITWWSKASPSRGFFMTYGAEEVFAPEIRDFVGFLRKADVSVETRDEEGGIHAWPVAALFLSSTIEERQKGLKTIVEQMRDQMCI